LVRVAILHRLGNPTLVGNDLLVAHRLGILGFLIRFNIAAFPVILVHRRVLFLVFFWHLLIRVEVDLEFFFVGLLELFSVLKVGVVVPLVLLPSLRRFRTTPLVLVADPPTLVGTVLLVSTRRLSLAMIPWDLWLLVLSVDLRPLIRVIWFRRRIDLNEIELTWLSVFGSCPGLRELSVHVLLLSLH